jgi:hypothetical protein
LIAGMANDKPSVIRLSIACQRMPSMKRRSSSERIAAEGSVAREDWGDYWAWLIEERIARPEDRPEFDRHLTETARTTATPRPGIMLTRRRPLADPERLHSRGEFAPAVRATIQEALLTVGEPGLPT